LAVRIQEESFEVGAEIERLWARRPSVGAIASFIGTVRDINEVEGERRSISSLTLEHYAGMTEAALEEICQEARARFEVIDALIVHRVGRLLPLDPIVLVVVLSSHRKDAFAACEFIMDYLKTQAPLWKKEVTPEGSRWVESRMSDDDAAQRWGTS
jgi:molybdopterin synthase catalytic subunit